MAEYVLGIDLGVQSVGWCLVDLDKGGNPKRVRSMGVRCFDSGVGSAVEIEMGKDESRNAARRLARQQRRQLWRRRRRDAHLFRVLQRNGLLPGKVIESGDERHEILLELDASLRDRYLTDGDRIEGHLLPYRLRALALDEELPLHAFGRAIYHLGQRRGFLTNKKAARDDEDEGVVKAGISELHEKIEKAGARTLGEYFAGLDSEDDRIRRRWTARSMFEEEFNAIWAAQAERHPEWTEAMRTEVHRAIFFQRPLKSQKHLIGTCDLEQGHRRAPLACLPYQRFRYWQKVNDLEVTSPEGDIRPLTNEERHLLAVTLDEKAELTFPAVHKLLGLSRTTKKTVGHEFNLEAGGEKRLVGNRTAAKLQGVLGERWDTMPPDDRERLVNEILGFEKEDALARRLQKAWQLDLSTAAEVAKLSFEPGYGMVSRKAIRALLPRMYQGERLNTARKEVYGGSLTERRVLHDELPPVLEAVTELRNPIVTRALTELRKVVNALIRKHGKPATVRIELARDMKRGRRAREEASRRMRQNENIRDRARQAIITEMKNSAPTETDILKWRLAEECNWECPYTGRPITPKALLGSHPQFDIEHILPFSRSLDNSFMNKTLSHHDENRHRKGNRTPHEAYGADPERWVEILQRVRRFQGDAARGKLRKFLQTDVDDGFAQRQLNDTRYISKLAGEYVGLLYGGRADDEGRLRVQVNSGGVTAFLRRQWGLHAVLGDPTIDAKQRDDHRHHAVDGLVIALSSPAMVRRLSHAAQTASERYSHRLFAEVELPWDNFVETARTAVDELIVSFRVDKRVSGSMHQDSIFSKPHVASDKTGKPTEYRHIRKPLAAMSAKEIEAIVDPRIRTLVQAKLDQLQANSSKVFEDEGNLPYFQDKNGRRTWIKKARIRRAGATLQVGSGSRARHVKPGGNHHVAIHATTDSKGREKWTEDLVSIFEAHRRLHDGEPVVRRVDGEHQRFVFSLAPGEFLLMRYKGSEEALYRCMSISQGDYEFRLHSDARTNDNRKNDRVRGGADALRKYKARKVVVSPIGEITPAND